MKKIMFDVGIDMESLRDDYGTVTGKCFIYSGTEKELSCGDGCENICNFTYYSIGGGDISIEYDYTCDWIKPSQRIDIESMLLDNFKSNVDIHFVKPLESLV